MKHTARVFSVLTLAGFCFAINFAHQTAPASIEKRTFKHHGEIDSRYDPSSDKTTVVLNPYRIPQDPMDTNVNPQAYSIMCGFTFKGRKLTGRPDTIEFHIISDGTFGWKFDTEQRRVLSATIDGERVGIGSMKLIQAKHYAIASSPANYGKDGFHEELYIPLTYEGILKIANGKRVLLIVGQQRVKLENEHIEALRDLASRMVP